MAFYLRKSFRMGPVRVNLSKSGLGVSAGVTGARIGITSQGKPYVHAGRGGLYIRKYASFSKGSAARSQMETGPVVLYEDTGVTFASSRIKLSSTKLQAQIIRPEQPVWVYALLLVAGLMLLAGSTSLLGTQRAVATVMGAALVLAWPVPTMIAWRRNRAGSQLGRTLEGILRPGCPIDDSRRREISDALNNRWVTSADRQYQSQVAYYRLALAIVRDGLVSDDDLEALAQAERLLKLSDTFIAEAKADAFREFYFMAIGDEELSEPEQATLDHIRRRLAIPEEVLGGELEVVRRLGEIRNIRQGRLPVIDPGTRLPRSEVCHYEAPARILKERNIRSFQREGRRYNVRGLVIDKEATLLITNKRILLVHQGVTAVRLDEVRDLDVDYDRSLLILSRDGARSPLIVTTPDALKAAAILAAAGGL